MPLAARLDNDLKWLESYGIVATGRMTMSLSHHGREVNNMVATSFKFAKELLSLRRRSRSRCWNRLDRVSPLGAPKSSENAGMCGLFVKSVCTRHYSWMFQWRKALRRWFSAQREDV